MIDEGLKRAAMIAIVVVVVGKLASGAYDRLTGTADEEMLANQQARENALHDQAVAQRQAENAERRADRCFKIQQKKKCEAPADFRVVESCLWDLRNAGCSQMPRINLCAVVEEFQECGDDFADQKKNGCDKLRRVAMCDRIPAPDDREDLWTITLSDGMWDGS